MIMYILILSISSFGVDIIRSIWSERWSWVASFNVSYCIDALAM